MFLFSRVSELEARLEKLGHHLAALESSLQAQAERVVERGDSVREAHRDLCRDLAELRDRLSRLEGRVEESRPGAPATRSPGFAEQLRASPGEDGGAPDPETERVWDRVGARIGEVFGGGLSVPEMVRRAREAGAKAREAGVVDVDGQFKE